MHYHDWEPFCIEPLTPEIGQKLTLRVKTAAKSGYLILDHHGEVERRPLKPVEGGLEVTLPMYVSPLRYCFYLSDVQGYLGSAGFSGVMPRYDGFFHLLAQPGVPEWAVGAVFYQIFPDRFRNGDPANDPLPGQWVYMGKPITVREWDKPVDGKNGPLQHYGGDLEGIRQSLDYLLELGIEALYLCPIFPSPSNHRYDAYDYLHIDPHLGGDEAFDRLVQEAKAKGIRIVLDGVFNHIGNLHPDFQKAQQDPSAPEAEMFNFHADGSYAAFFGVKTLPKLDYSSPLATERYLSGPKSPVRQWLQRGIDGWRLDVAHQIGQHGTDRGNLELLRLIHRTSREENPEALVFGELSFDTVGHLRAHTLDGSMHYAGFCNPLMDWLSGQNIFGWPVSLSPQEVWQTLYDHYCALPLQVRQTMYTLIGSHDIPRALWRLKGDVKKFKVALGLLMAFPGAPGVYYGDEIGLSQTNPYSEFMGDPMCRAPMPWNPQQWNLEVRGWLKQLIELKKTLPALRRGGLRSLEAPDGVLAFKRTYQDQEIWVYANPQAPITIELPAVQDLLSQQLVQGPVSLQGFRMFLKGD